MSANVAQHLAIWVLGGLAHTVRSEYALAILRLALAVVCVTVALKRARAPMAGLVLAAIRRNALALPSVVAAASARLLIPSLSAATAVKAGWAVLVMCLALTALRFPWTAGSASAMTATLATIATTYALA